MELPYPIIDVHFDYENNTLTLSTDNFAHYVYIYVDDDISLKLSNNFFDLTPGFNE